MRVRRVVKVRRGRRSQAEQGQDGSQCSPELLGRTGLQSVVMGWTEAELS